MKSKEAFGIFFRYFILLLLPLVNLWLFYYIFTPATVYPAYWILHKLIGAGPLINSYGNCSESGAPAIFIKGYYSCIIGACIAGAAYYFLTILNLSTPMKIKKRIKSLLFMFSTFLILNILRIVIFADLVYVGYKYFDITHQLVWYFGSTILVVLVWFTNVLLFNINGVPIYTDVCALLRVIKSGGKK